MQDVQAVTYSYFKEVGMIREAWATGNWFEGEEWEREKEKG